jgi:hypothetical protein
MEFFLLIVFFALCLVAYGAIRVARRVYARREQPEDAERTFLKAMLTKPPPKPDTRYSLTRRPAAAPPRPPPEDRS